MAKNFKIQISGTDKTVFFDLIGDFDGSSAFELLNTLQEKVSSPEHKVYVNTSRLKTVHSFGREVFTRNFACVSHADRVLFTGAFASEIAPVEKTTVHWRQDVQNDRSIAGRFNKARFDPQPFSAGGE